MLGGVGGIGWALEGKILDNIIYGPSNKYTIYLNQAVHIEFKFLINVIQHETLST